MFDFIRTHQKLMQLLLLVLILPSFVVFGVSSYKSGAAADAVAMVGDRPVTQIEWDNAQRNQIDRMRAMMGPQFNQKMFETPEFKMRALDELVLQRTIDQEMNRAYMTVSESVLTDNIKNLQEFQKDGKFDLEFYRQYLAIQGMSEAGFMQTRRHALAMSQLTGAVPESAFAPRSVTQRISDIYDQEREVQEIVFKSDDFNSKVSVDDAKVKAYYEQHASEFQVPEQAKIEYVVFDQAVVESQVSVSDAEIRAYYDAPANKAKLETPEQRTASHILVMVKKDAPAAEKAAAKAKAEAILAEVKKAPANFAKIAKEKSDDKASAVQGGDLGTVERGAFVKSVDDAIFKMKQGEISDLVESEFGYHIIELTSLKPAVMKSYDDAKGMIAAELKKQKMGKKYSELTEAFTNTVYEQADSLKPVADKLKLTIQTATLNGRTPAPNDKTVLANPKFLKAIFSDDAIKNKRNTEAVDVGNSTLIAGRIAEYKPAAKRPLAEVEGAIRQRVTQEEAMKLAKKAGDEKIAAAKPNGDASGFGETKVVTRTKQPTINPTGALAVMKADVSKLPAYVGVDLPGQGYGVYRISKVSQPAEVDKARREGEAQQIAQAMGQNELYAYVDALKAKAKAKVLVKASDIKAAQPAEAN